MIINGKEVAYTQKRAENIQTAINKTENMPQYTKHDLTRQETKELADKSQMWGGGSSDGYGTDGGFLGNGYGVQNNNFIDSGPEVENRLNYYSCFQEMSENNFINRGLQAIADDATQKNQEGNVCSIYSDDDDIKNILEDLFHRRLNLTKEMWSIVYEMAKLGDNFYEIIPDSYENPTEIVRIRYLDPYRVNRIEKNGKLAFYTYTSYDHSEESPANSKSGGKEIQYRLQPWQIIHFKITDKDFYPYGGSLLKSGVRTYRRLNMLEDAMLVYRVARTPERRIFRIGVGNMATNEANRFVQKVRDNYRTTQVLDSEGRINRKAAALSLNQDIFIPVREGETGTNIDTLQGGTGLNNIDDIKYFRDQILWTLNISPESLGYLSDNGGGAGTRGSIAMQDIKFARFVERIQYYIEEGLTKIAYIELFFKKKRKSDLGNFKLELTAPSNIKEVMDLEFVNQKINLISSMAATQMFSTSYILKYVMRLSRKEIDDIILQKDIEKQKEAGAQMDSGMGGMDMGIGGMDMGGMDMGGLDMGVGAEPPMGAEVGVPLNQDFVNIFGKEVLIERKEDFAKILQAAEDYKREKAEGLIKEKDENEMLPSEMMDKIKEIFSGKEKEKTNDFSSLFYEGEMTGLNFSENTLKIYSKPRKRSGPKGNKNDIIIEETEIFLDKEVKRKGRK